MVSLAVLSAVSGGLDPNLLLVALLGAAGTIGTPVVVLFLTWGRQDRLAEKVDAVRALSEANHTLANSAATRQLKVEKRGNERELVLLRTNRALLEKLGLKPDPEIDGEIEAAKASIAELTETIAQQERNGVRADAQIAAGKP